MRTMRVPMTVPGDYRQVRVYGRYGSIVVTESTSTVRRGYVMTHALSGQRASDAVFVRLDVARQCARALSKLDWSAFDQWAEAVRANPWSESARAPKGTRTWSAAERRVDRVVRRHERAEAKALRSRQRRAA